MALFTTALNLHGGVLWSGELQGFIIPERVPTEGQNAGTGPCATRAPPRLGDMALEVAKMGSPYTRGSRYHRPRPPAPAAHGLPQRHSPNQV
jgi:hypothetical protein